MKVLHVISAMDPVLGGVCQAVRTIVGGLSALGVDNEIVSLDDPDAPFLPHEAVAIHAVGPAKGPWQYSSRLLPWLRENIGRFDAVILHGLWLYQGYAVRKALLAHHKQQPAAPPRLYIMPHGMLDPYFQQAAGRKLKALRNRLYWKFIEKDLVNQAGGILFTCEEERRLAAQPFQPYRPKQEFVVGLGVEEPATYTPEMREAFLAQCPALHDQPYLLFLSRIHPKKGVDMLLKAYASSKLSARHGAAALVPSAEKTLEQPLPDSVALAVAGPGLDTPYGRTIRELASPATPVVFAGMLSGNAKWGAFYGCAAFVLPSHQENFGIAVVEALACGKPVLISNRVNIWREIEAAGAGLVAADTVDGTTQLLEQWNQLPEFEKQIMSRQARLCFQQDFAVGAMATRLLDALRA